MGRLRYLVLLGPSVVFCFIYKHVFFTTFLGTEKLIAAIWVPAAESMSQETTLGTQSRVGVLQGSWGPSGIKSMLLLRDKS